MKVKSLLLFFYLKTIGRLFAYIMARRHPNNENILFTRFMAKYAKRKMMDSGNESW